MVKSTASIRGIINMPNLTNDKTRTRAHAWWCPCGFPLWGMFWGAVRCSSGYHRWRIIYLPCGRTHGTRGGQWHLLCNLDIFLWILYFWYEKRGSSKTYPVSNPETYPFSTPETYPFVEWGYISRRVTPLSYRQSMFLSTPKRHPPPIFIFFLTIVSCISIITVKSYISLANLPTFSTYI